jgi:hypothetical protein
MAFQAKTSTMFTRKKASDSEIRRPPKRQDNAKNKAPDELNHTKYRMYAPHGSGRLQDKVSQLVEAVNPI